MKKPPLIIAALLLLIAVVGIERISWISESPSQKAPPLKLQIAPVSGRKLRDPLFLKDASQPSNQLSSQPPAPGTATQQSRSRLSELTAHEPEPMDFKPGARVYFIHSDQLKDSNNHLDLNLLQLALRSIDQTQNGRALVMDYDASTTFQISFLVYADPKHDLTEVVRARYEKLLADSQAASKDSSSEPSDDPDQ